MNGSEVTVVSASSTAVATQSTAPPAMQQTEEESARAAQVLAQIGERAAEAVAKGTKYRLYVTKGEEIELCAGTDEDEEKEG